MKIFDYFFYRTYRFQKTKNNPALFSSSIYTAAVFLDLTAFVWYELLRAINGKVPDFQVLLLYGIFSVVFYLKYKKDKEQIVKRFNSSKYNKLIPNWILPIVLPLSIVIGFILDYTFRRLLGI